MKSQIQISVIMPAYNAEKYIAQAIESVLQQDVELELIVIDDASVDDTAKSVEKYTSDDRVIFIQNKENMGVAESRNVGIRRARGKYIAFLDADDWWLEGKLKEQYEKLERSGQVLCCTGRNLEAQMAAQPESTLVYRKKSHMPCCLGQITFPVLL